MCVCVCVGIGVHFRYIQRDETRAQHFSWETFPKPQSNFSADMRQQQRLLVLCGKHLSHKKNRLLQDETDKNLERTLAK